MCCPLCRIYQTESDLFLFFFFFFTAAEKEFNLMLLTEHRELRLFTFPLSNHVGCHAHIYPRIGLFSIWDCQLSSANLPKKKCRLSMKQFNTKCFPLQLFQVNVIRGEKRWVCDLERGPRNGARERSAGGVSLPWSCHLWGQGELYLSSRRWWVQGVHVEADTPDWQSLPLPPPRPGGSVWNHHVALGGRKRESGYADCSFITTQKSF